MKELGNISWVFKDGKDLERRISGLPLGETSVSKSTGKILS
jgi:hypothetical protein